MQLSSLERDLNFGLSIYCHTLYMQEPKVLTRQACLSHGCTVAYVIRKKQNLMCWLLFVYYSHKDCVKAAYLPLFEKSMLDEEET